MPIEKLGTDGWVATGGAIQVVRLVVMKGALRMEIIGLRSSRGSVAPLVREAINSKTKNKAALLNELILHIDKVKHDLALT